jgi:all-trans-retinol 13,14-reductase
MVEEKTKYDAIVIGAGVSGLLIALALSKENKKVLVIEKNNFLGGNCRTYKINGYSVDTGPHAITDLKTGPLVQLMDKYFSVKPEFVPIKSYYARDGKKLQEIPLTLPQFAMFDILSRRDRVLLLGAIMDSVVFSSINKKVLDKSVYEYIKKYGFSEKALKLIDAISYFLSGRSMRETPMWRIFEGAGYADKTSNFPRINKIRKIISNNYSSQSYPVGGIQSIPNCILDSMPKNSVDFHVGEKLDKFIVEGGRMSGVRTDKGTYYCGAAIYSGFAKDLPNFTDCLEKKYIESLKKIKQTQSLTLWLGLKEKIPELSYIGSEVYFDADTPYWAMPVSNFDPSLAPEGKQLMGFTTIIKEKTPESQLKKLKNIIFKALPKIKEKIEFEHIQITIPEKAAVTVGVKFPSPRSPIKKLYLVGTDADMRSMGITRAAFSVNEALKFMREDQLI